MWLICSEQLAQQAIVNALVVLKPGGCLFVVEPLFNPAWMVFLIFCIKLLVTWFTDRRVGLARSWLNIGGKR